MAIVTSSDTDDSRKAAVAKSAGSAVLGYVVPWSTPARAVAKRVVRRRAKPARVQAASVTVPRLPRKAKRSSMSPRGRLIVLGLAGIIGGGVVFSAIRRGQHTPPPVAAAPPRVEDVPTR